ncbi:MAG: hypothetical protein ACI9EX_002169, partial [Oleispira sp.]
MRNGALYIIKYWTLRTLPMARISALLVKELRERTGLGMMECKKA